MNITGVSRTQGVYPPSKPKNAVRAGRPEGYNEPYALSSTAKDYQTVRNAMPGISDVRQNKINEIMKKMDSGPYLVSSADIAEKIMDNMASF